MVEAAVGYAGAYACGKATREACGPGSHVKWCCILLNDFLPVGSSRRRFAYSDFAQEELKVEQLRKAQQMLLILTNRSN